MVVWRRVTRAVRACLCVFGTDACMFGTDACLFDTDAGAHRCSWWQGTYDISTADLFDHVRKERQTSLGEVGKSISMPTLPFRCPPPRRNVQHAAQPGKCRRTLSADSATSPRVVSQPTRAIVRTCTAARGVPATASSARGRTPPTSSAPGAGPKPRRRAGPKTLRPTATRPWRREHYSNRHVKFDRQTDTARF